MRLELDGELISHKFAVAKYFISKNCTYLKKLEISASLPITKQEAVRLCMRTKELISSMQDNGKRCKCQLKAFLLKEWGVWRWRKFFAYDERVQHGLFLFYKELRIIGRLFWYQQHLQVLDLTGFGAPANLGTRIIDWAATHCGRSLTTIELMDYFIPELIYPKEPTFIMAISQFTYLNHFGINNYALYPQDKILETIANKNRGKLQTLAIQCRGWDPVESLRMDFAVWAKVRLLCPDLKLHLCLKNIGSKEIILNLLPKTLPLYTLVFWLKFDASNEGNFVKTKRIVPYHETDYTWLLLHLYICFRTTIDNVNIHLTEDTKAFDKVVLLLLIRECPNLTQVEIEAPMTLEDLDLLCMTVSLLKRIQKFHVILLNVSEQQQRKLQIEYYKYQILLASVKDWYIVANDKSNDKFRRGY